LLVHAYVPCYKYSRTLALSTHPPPPTHTIHPPPTHPHQHTPVNVAQVGSEEGSFRYADPSDGSDALCAKLTELTDAVVASASLSADVHNLPFKPWGHGDDDVTAATGGGGGGGGGGTGGTYTQQVNISMHDGVGSAQMLVHLPLTDDTGGGDGVGGDEIVVKAAVAANPLRVVTCDKAAETDATDGDDDYDVCGGSGGGGGGALSDAPQRMLSFDVPLQFITAPDLLAAGSCPDDAGSGGSTSTSTSAAPAVAPGTWESYLVDGIVQEALQLATLVQSLQQPTTATTSAHTTTTTSTATKQPALLSLPVSARLHAALLLQRARSLDVHVRVHCSASVTSRLSLCVDQLRAMLGGDHANLARLRDAKTALPTTAATTAATTTATAAATAATAVTAAGGGTAPGASGSGSKSSSSSSRSGGGGWGPGGGGGAPQSKEGRGRMCVGRA
jgi:hypothetical protein